MFLLFLCISNVQRYFLLGCQAFHERPGQLAVTNANLYLSVSAVKSLFQEEVEIPFDSVRKGKIRFSRIKLGVKLTAHRVGLPVNVDLITGSAFLHCGSPLPPSPLLPTGRKAGHPADLPVNWGILMQHWARIEINKSDFKRS